MSNINKMKETGMVLDTFVNSLRPIDAICQHVSLSAGQHQIITWTTIDLLAMKSCGINPSPPSAAYMCQWIG